MSGRLDTTVDWVDRQLQRIIPQGPQPWWLWPAFLVLMGAGAVTVSALVTPGEGELLYLFGSRFGNECGFMQATGLPCASCGMTRSWVWLVRGHLWRAWTYSPGGASLLLWLILASGLGLARLVTRKPKLLQLDYRLLAGWVLVWMVGLNLGAWLLRLLGVNPLP